MIATVTKPPPEAYGRVTNPDRFVVLHEFAQDWLDQLEQEFAVGTEVGLGLDVELEAACKLARPIIRVLPTNQDAAPLAVAFTSFPGLYVRFGRWYKQAYPVCGCDACNEEPTEQIQILQQQLKDLTEGRFREQVEDFGPEGVWYSWQFPSLQTVGGGESRLQAGDRGLWLNAGQRSSHEWKPWSRRTAKERE